MIKEFLSYYIKRIKRYFQEDRKSRFLVASLMLLAIFLLAFAIFQFTREGLILTQEGTDPFLTQAIPFYIYQLFFLITGFLIFVSSSIFGLFNFFKNEADDWIMATPEFENLSWIKFFRALIDSSWPLLILALPLLLAVQNVFNFSHSYFLLITVNILFFSIFVSGAAIVIIFLISLILKSLKIKSFKVLSFSVGLISILMGGLIWSRIVAVDISTLFQVQEAIDPDLTYLKDNFSIFPSYFPAAAIFYSQLENIEEVLGNTIPVLIVFSAILLLFIILKRKFLYIWQLFREASFEAKPETKKFKTRIIPVMPKSKEDTIFKKELLFNFRSSKNLFWLGFLTILMLAQVGVINLLARYTEIAGNDLSTSALISGLQMGVILFFTSALILRFVFPSLSQEGSTSWILGSAPIDFKKIFEVKYNFYSLLLFFIGLMALLLYLVSLEISLEIGLLSFLIMSVSIFTLTRIGLSLGTIFINFKTDDPQKLSTSAPGIAFTLIALFYAASGSYLLFNIISGKNRFLLILFILSSIAISFLFKKSALNSLKKMEFL